MLMGFVSSMSLNFKIWGVFLTNEAQMEQNEVGRWRVGGGLKVPSGSWLILGICSLSVLVLHETLLVPVLMYGSETVMEGEI